ncbi:MAG: type II secretion system GspH family protein, partial [Deltaproteobacteria bacterium]|nr:type II secretion system GspH family protein [Deltaproteobacteria bacterium]
MCPPFWHRRVCVPTISKEFLGGKLPLQDRRQRQAGFTLIELMVVLFILGLLA